MSTPAPEPDDVVLLGEDGRPAGRAARARVHTRETPLHLAFSFHAHDAAGRALLTRRALHKVAWPGVWSNACCGHPRPGEELTDAVRRRVREELGAQVADLRCALPDFRYRAVDASGIVENEVCPVFLGTLVDDALDPDPGEVMDHAWVDPAGLLDAARRVPTLLSPWSVLQLGALAEVTAAGAPRSPSRPS